MRTQNSWMTAVLMATAMLANESRVAAQLQLNAAEVEASRSADLPPPEGAYREKVQQEPAPVARAQLGIRLDPDIADAAVVASVMPGGAAEQAGLQPGDAIEAVNGYRVESPRDLLESIAALRPGDIVEIDFARRITGRTQAVLAGGPQERSLLASPERPTRRRDAAQQAAYEELPAPPDLRERSPTYARDRVQPTAPRRVDEPRYRANFETNADDRDAQRDERSRRGRWIDRDREPSTRRPLLRWRR